MLLAQPPLPPPAQLPPPPCTWCAAWCAAASGAGEFNDGGVDVSAVLVLLIPMAMVAAIPAAETATPEKRRGLNQEQGGAFAVLGIGR